jgi:hypothetical protein
MVAWSAIVSVVGVIGAGALVAALRRRRPHWGPERYWVVGLGALSPAWLVAFLGTIEPPGGAEPNKPLFIITSALPLLGIIVTDALLRRWRASGRLLRPVQAWLLGIAAVLPGWGLALITLAVKSSQR